MTMNMVIMGTNREPHLQRIAVPLYDNAAQRETRGRLISKVSVSKYIEQFTVRTIDNSRICSESRQCYLDAQTAGGWPEYNHRHVGCAS